MQAALNLAERLEPDPILATHRVLMESHGPTSPGASARAESADRWQPARAARRRLRPCTPWPGAARL